jgi:hypothetical protein
MRDLTNWCVGDENSLALNYVEDHDTNTSDGDEDNSIDD